MRTARKADPLSERCLLRGSLLELHAAVCALQCEVALGELLVQFFGTCVERERAWALALARAQATPRLGIGEAGKGWAGLGAGCVREGVCDSLGRRGVH